MMDSHLICLPAEILLYILSFLNADELQVVSTTCSKLRIAATGDDLWKPIVQSCLAVSPPAHSSNVSPITNPPPPWDPEFGLVSTNVNPAYKEKWFATPPRAEDAESNLNINHSNRQFTNLTAFPGADSFYQVYWKFVRHLYKLLGWWMGDLPSYGMIVRIVFNPIYRSTGADASPAFICEKVHLVNRLQGMGANALRSPWMEAASFDSASLRGTPGSDGTTIETERISIDVSVPGIKTEKLWVASWDDCRHLDNEKLFSGIDLARISWQGSQAATKVTEQGNALDSAILGRHGQPSIVSRARALAAQMVFGHTSPEAERENQANDTMNMDEEDEDDELPEVGPGVFGNGLTISQIVAASAVDTFENGDFDHIPYHLRTIQQRSGHQTHTVFLSSGAILTTPAREKGSKRDSITDQRLSLRCEKYRPYENAQYNQSRAFGLNLLDYMPLPPLDFPPPALLPLVKDVDDDFSEPSQIPMANSSFAYERFLDQGTDFQLNSMRMEPCPPYRPWPHLSQPQPSGLRFVSIQSPPRHTVWPVSSRKESGEEVTYEHPISIPSHLDPGSFEFDWNSLQGLYGMTYGPWGLETIYVRSRILTEHDFKSIGVALGQDDVLARPTGPHGPGHILQEDTRLLQETIHWRPEPYIDVSDLQMRSEDVQFIKPGCRVIEGVKCSGDANVPRGTISFRAFSRGQDRDSCVAYFAPDSTRWANFPPWDGRGIDHRGSRIGHQYDAFPGRIIECGTGRLAMEGFVNAGCWKRCSIKITSADEIHVYWEALRKVAVARRLVAC